MEFYVGQQKDEWRLHQDYSSLQYEGSFWYLFYGKRDFPDELLHSIEDDGFKAIVAEVNECIFFIRLRRKTPCFSYGDIRRSET